MQQTRQRTKINSTNPNSAYFTHVENTSRTTPPTTTTIGTRLPPPPPPPPPPLAAGASGPSRNYSYGSYGSSTGSASGYAGYGGGGACSPTPMTRSAPISSYASPAPAAQVPINYSVNCYGSDSYEEEIKSHTSELPRSRKRGKGCGGSLSCGFVFCLFLLWTGALGGGAYYWYTEIQMPEVHRHTHALENQVLQLEDRAQQLLREQQVKAEEEKAKFLQQQAARERALQTEHDKTVHELRTQLNQANARAEQPGKSAGSEAEDLHQTLAKKIQVHSKRSVIQKYGPGPHQVEFAVQFASEKGRTFYILAELASIDEMPHTVLTFLDQITSGLYNDGGFTFHRNGGHVVFGSPKDPKRFEDTGPMISEYSNQMPHGPMTIGLANKLGPDIYINTIDNTHTHGPEGTWDPCFAKILRGIDVVERMHQQSGPLKKGDWKEMLPGPVEVKEVFLLPST